MCIDTKFWSLRAFIAIGCLAYLCSLSGCGSSGNDGGGGTGGNGGQAGAGGMAGTGGAAGGGGSPGAFLVSWTLLELAESEPRQVTCSEAGIATIQTILQPLDGGDPIIERFNCIDGGIGDVSPAALGEYQASIEALDSRGLVVAQSERVEETLVDTTPVDLDFTILVDGGFFTLTWTVIQDTAPPVTISCEEAGANAVSVLITPVGNAADAEDELFDCASGMALTSPWPLGELRLAVDLINDNGTPNDPGDDLILSTEPALFSESIDFGNQRVDLGNVDFLLEP